jgi:hypothetical protein
MLLSGLASLEKHARKETTNDARVKQSRCTPKNCNRRYAIIKKCERNHAFRNLARMFFENWEFVLANYIPYGCSRTD